MPDRHPLPVYQLAYYYPPIVSVGVRRGAAVTAMFADHGHEVTVVTSEHTPASDPRANVEVLRVAVLDYRSRGRGEADFAPPASLKSSALYRAFGRLSNSFPSNLLLGEGGALYITRAYRTLSRRIAASEGRGIVFSTFRPWADLQVAFLLKRRYPQLIWWCDWRDTPFELRHRNYVWLSFQRRVLKVMLRSVDQQTAVSRGVLADLPEITAASQVVYNGVSLPAAASPAQTRVLPTGRFIAYTGSLYGPNRDPRPAMRAVAGSGSREFVLLYAGKDGALWREYLKETGAESFAVDLGVVDAPVALEIQRAASVNLLLTWGNEGQTGGLTMKIFEYLQAGRPILRIHDGAPDPEIDEVLAQAAAPTYTCAASQPTTEGIAIWLATLDATSSYATQTSWLLRDRLEEFYRSRLSGLCHSNDA